jgi:IS30 family transposase
MAKRISGHLEQEVHRLRALGYSLNEIGQKVECSRKAVANALMRERVPAREWMPGPGRLSRAEREEIRVGLEREETFTLIASGLGRAVSTISRRQR